MSSFTRAIVRPPGANFAEGLTSQVHAVPNLDLARRQHAVYCQTLEECGLTVTVLQADDRHADSTFVEDVAIVTERCAVLTRPGAPSRQGEVANLRAPLMRYFPQLETIEAPGTLDGGDICQAGEHFFLGISQRTNEEGARQLAVILSDHGYTSTTVDLRAMRGVLHLKSAIAWLGDRRLLVWEEMANRGEFQTPEAGGFQLVPVPPAEAYAANCVLVNGKVLMAQGYPKVAELLTGLGLALLSLEVSEFRQMDGGLSCLSLRF